MSPIETIPEIYALLLSNIPSKANFPALATVSAQGLPTVRAVVLRGFDPSTHRFWINTHLLSGKVKHLHLSPVAELAIWLPTSQIQLRLRATFQLITTTTRTPAHRQLRVRSWHAQSSQAQASYFWPPPGQPFAAPLPPSEKPRTGIPSAFTVLLGKLSQIDALHLTQPYHTRYLHTLARRAWRSQAITA